MLGFFTLVGTTPSPLRRRVQGLTQTSNPPKDKKTPGRRAHHRQPGPADAIVASANSHVPALVQPGRRRDGRVNVALRNIFTLLELGHQAVDLLDLPIQIGLRMRIL